MLTTESESLYHDLDKMSTRQLLDSINQEDRKVPIAVAAVIPAIEGMVDAITDRMLAGGRLFYIGAGTSGRLGIVDASECPPTYGVPQDLVIGLIAGGDGAIRQAVEFAAGWRTAKPTTSDFRPCTIACIFMICMRQFWIYLD